MGRGVVNLFMVFTFCCIEFQPQLHLIIPPTLKKLMGHIAFGACVRAWVGHTFCTYCNF